MNNQKGIKDILDILLDLDGKAFHAKVELSNYVDFVCEELEIILDEKDKTLQLKNLLLRTLNREFNKVGHV